MGKIFSSTKLPLHVFHNMPYTIMSSIISQMVVSHFSWLKIQLRCFVKYWIMSKWHTQSFIRIKLINWTKKKIWLLAKNIYGAHIITLLMTYLKDWIFETQPLFILLIIGYENKTKKICIRLKIYSIYLWRLSVQVTKINLGFSHTKQTRKLNENTLKHTKIEKETPHSGVLTNG